MLHCVGASCLHFAMQLYLGGFSPALVTEGNMVMATEKSLESTPGANGNSLVIHAAISVPASLVRRAPAGMRLVPQVLNYASRMLTPEE